MANFTPTPLTTLANEAAAVSRINDNLTDIADAIESKLSRDGELPNQMEADLDMNSNDILNVGEIYFNNGTILGGNNPWPGGGGSGGGGSVTIRDEGTVIASAASSINFVGANIQATAVGSAVTVEVDVEVTPRYWEFVGNGVETDFIITGANVEDELFYEAYVGGVGQRPGVAFTIIVGPDPANSIIRFTAPPSNGVNGWVILKAISPSAGSVASPQMRVFTVAGTTETISATYRQGHILTTNANPVTLTLRANDGNGALDWKSGDYFTVDQKGTGQVTVNPASGVVIQRPTGYNPATRVRYSVISFVCIDPSTNTWTCGNDMAVSV